MQSSSGLCRFECAAAVAELFGPHLCRWRRPALLEMENVGENVHYEQTYPVLREAMAFGFGNGAFSTQEIADQFRVH